MRMLDARKYPRYKAKKPICLHHDHTQGIMIEASREGALIIIETNELKPVGSKLTLTVFLDTQSAKQNHDQKQSKVVTVTAEVKRHTKYKNRNAMGLQFIAMDEKHIAHWLNFLGKIKSRQEVLPFGTYNPSQKSQKKLPGFTIRFQDMQYIKDFLPNNPGGSFFIPTQKVRTKNKKIRLTLVHPGNDELLQIEGVVQHHCDKRVGKTNQDGLLCTFASLDQALIEKIHTFINEPIYQHR